MIVNADGLPLGVSFSEARDIIALDGHVLISLPTAADDTVILKITALGGYLHTLSSSRVVGEELLAGSTSDCVYQVTVIGDDKGQGFANLCEKLVSAYIITITNNDLASGVIRCTATLKWAPPWYPGQHLVASWGPTVTPYATRNLLVFKKAATSH